MIHPAGAYFRGTSPAYCSKFRCLEKGVVCEAEWFRCIGIAGGRTWSKTDGIPDWMSYLVMRIEESHAYSEADKSKEDG
jgi:hypothetical protein